MNNCVRLAGKKRLGMWQQLLRELMKDWEGGLSHGQKTDNC